MNLLKVGGSVLTDKRTYRTPDADAIARTAAELARAPRPLVLVHGAGSYGHVVAHEHGLAHGRTGTPAQDAAFARTHEDVLDLRRLLVRTLQEAGVPALGLSPLELTTLRDGEVASFDTGPVAHALARDLVPVLHGDVAYDESRGYGIVSGDQVMVQLAARFQPARAVFASDVDGILDPGPDAPDARLLHHVQARRFAAGGARGRDVTGGMGGKLRRMGEIAATGATVRVVNGRVPGRVLAALTGEDTMGTEVKP